MGRITRAHGLRGEVVVALTTTEERRVAPGAELHTADGRVLVVDAARPHQGKWVTTLVGVAGREAAESLRGTVLFAEPLAPGEDDDPDALWVHELIGARVVEADGTDRGAVEAVQDNPASDLLVLEGGALVPLRFVVGWRERPALLEIDVPPGLFED